MERQGMVARYLFPSKVQTFTQSHTVTKNHGFKWVRQVDNKGVKIEKKSGKVVLNNRNGVRG